MSKLIEALDIIAKLPRSEKLLLAKEAGFNCHTIPQQPQCQDALDDQLRELTIAGNRLGLYDAVDVVQRLLKKGER